MLEFARYDKAQLSDSYKRLVYQRVEAGMLTRETADQLVQEYEALANRTTYLE
jgi:arginine decarboxylase-like protein